MHLQKKLMTYVISGTVALSSLGMATPSFARDGHHHHTAPRSRAAHRQHYHHQDRIWIGLGIGAAVGAIAVGAADHNGYYHGPYYARSCRQVITRRRCHENYWGEYRCRQVRYVRYIC